MNGAGAIIAKTLRKFTKKHFQEIAGIMQDPAITREDADWCLWMVKDYPQTLNALAKLPDFGGNKKMADAYLCGYWRGIQEAAFRLNQSENE
jgi:hypothetical protein